MTTSTPGRTRDRLVRGAAGVLAAAGIGGVVLGLSAQEGAAPSPESGHGSHGAASSGPSAGHEGHGGPSVAPSPSPTAPAPAPSAAAYERPTGPTMARSEPVRVRIPDLDVSTDVIDLGLQPNRRMEVPQDGRNAGWYTGSPTPGELGPSVIAAHVTWKKKPAVFFRLGAMRAGQLVEVDRADGSTAVFEVTEIGQYPKAAFPTERVYGTVDRAALRLITCGGALDGETGHHVDNVVVYAQLRTTRPT